MAKEDEKPPVRSDEPPKNGGDKGAGPPPPKGGGNTATRNPAPPPPVRSVAAPPRPPTTQEYHEMRLRGLIPDANPERKSYPGFTPYVEEALGEGKRHLVGPVGRLDAVTRVSQIAANISQLDPDASFDRRADELAKAAEEHIDVLQGGIDAIEGMLEAAHDIRKGKGDRSPESFSAAPGPVEPAPYAGEVGLPGSMGTAAPPGVTQYGMPSSATPPGINSAPVPYGPPGSMGTGRPDGYQGPNPGFVGAKGQVYGPPPTAPGYLRGVDESMSGGPPRPNTGANQPFNQPDVPTAHTAEQPAVHAGPADSKQQTNPPNAGQSMGSPPVETLTTPGPTVEPKVTAPFIQGKPKENK